MSDENPFGSIVWSALAPEPWPLPRTYGELRDELEGVERLSARLVKYLDQLGPNHLHWEPGARPHDDYLAACKARMGRVEGIHELIAYLRANGDRLMFAGLVKLRPYLGGSGPFDPTIDALTIPDVVAPLRGPGEAPVAALDQPQAELDLAPAPIPAPGHGPGWPRSRPRPRPRSRTRQGVMKHEPRGHGCLPTGRAAKD